MLHDAPIPLKSISILLLHRIRHTRIWVEKLRKKSHFLEIAIASSMGRYVERFLPRSRSVVVLQRSQFLKVPICW